ncbi:MAG: stage II sporulation protein D [Clostridia bacterium]|nr:stage II sporulation protein D [Clostridia bacterium]
MKKIIFYVWIFVIVCFFIPIIFVKRDNKETVANVDENTIEQTINENENVSNYDYKEYNTIKLLHSKDDSIEEIPIDEYLYGVVSAEMPASFEKEALKAQAVVARTYTIFKIEHSGNKHGDADICDDSNCCQAWISKENRFARWEENERENNWNKIVNAVEETKGKVVEYDGQVINAFFHSNSGGKTETTLNVWGGNGYPYLQAVETAGEDAYSQYQSEVSLSKEEFIEKMKDRYPDFEINFDNIECIKVLEYTDSNRVKKIRIGNKELSGVEVRSLMGLKSANFKIEIENDEVSFEVIGYGHGVGMSQTGADSMAKEGNSYEDIIKHFYTGVEIVDI